jgi:hypothetical protein
MPTVGLSITVWVLFVLLAMVVLLAGVLGRAFLKYRGQRVITCPENQRPAGVAVDTGHVLRAALGGKTDLRLKTCSRWPERRDCGQQCLEQIGAAPEGCLVRHVLAEWYRGKHCVICGKPIGEIQWADHKPALLNAQGHTVEWREIAPQDVPDTLAADKPVCWNCHIVNRMRSEHPELVLDRSRHA